MSNEQFSTMDDWREQFTGSGDAEKDAAFQEVLADVEAACYGTPEEREDIIRKWERTVRG